MPNVNILVLSHPLGDLGVRHRVHPWLDGKHTVDFLLVITEQFITQCRVGHKQYIKKMQRVCLYVTFSDI